MNRKNWDYEKYGGYLDPEDPVFFGPITKRELMKSVEMAEKFRKKKKNIRKTNATCEPIQETCETSILDRTFDVIDTENIDPASEETKADLNRTYELDESQNSCLCPRVENHANDYNGEDTVSAQQSNKTISDNDDPDYRPHLISILCDPFKDLSNLNENLAKTKISAFEAHDTSNVSAKAVDDTSILKKGSLLDDTCSTIVAGRLQTPLLEKLRKSGSTRSGDRSNVSLDKTLTNDNSVCTTTPRVIKLSDTFITELLPENCLINSSLNESTHQRTPDVFRQKRNEIWQKNSPATKKLFGSALHSKLPMLKKTPSGRSGKCLPTKSPVADYIHKGISVQSASKVRHSGCVLHESSMISKSAQKDVKHCRIPVSTNAFVKRKLQMSESKLPGLKK